MGCIGKEAGQEEFLGGASIPVWNFWRESVPRAFTGSSPSRESSCPVVESCRRQTSALLTAPEVSRDLYRPRIWDLAELLPAPLAPGESRPGPEGSRA